MGIIIMYKAYRFKHFLGVKETNQFVDIEPNMNLTV